MLIEEEIKTEVLKIINEYLFEIHESTFNSNTTIEVKINTRINKKYGIDWANNQHRLVKNKRIHINIYTSHFNDKVSIIKEEYENSFRTIIRKKK
jgi:nanoRNase/pAp phosphatase (c-di-AMP/oligoRNAs hydrolase)